MTPIWYHVRDLDSGRAFYTQKLGFTETYVNENDSWAQLQRNETEIGIAQGEPQDDGSVAHVDVDDVKALAEELRNEGVEVEQLSSMRKTIARRVTEAWQAPVFQLSLSIDMGRALELRKRLVELHGEAVKPTLNDLLTKVCAAAKSACDADK